MSLSGVLHNINTCILLLRIMTCMIPIMERRKSLMFMSSIHCGGGAKVVNARPKVKHARFDHRSSTSPIKTQAKGEIIEEISIRSRHHYL